jgi:CHAT domain-containing protein
MVSADLFHLAGHGTYLGRGGWESHLPLAGDSRLTLGDLLALERVPERVVLSTCDAGHPSGEASIEGVNLAHAFLIAGSRSVLAAVKPVHDRAARQFLTRLYQGWNGTGDLAVALRRAQLAGWRESPTGDWRSFRLFEP